MRRCDRHGHELAGASPAITLERREYVGEGKGARRNSFDLPEEEQIGDKGSVRDLTEVILLTGIFISSPT